MKNIFVACCLTVVVLCQKPPVFPDQYELDFSEHASVGPLSGDTKGKIYFDAKNNRELITRENGHHDRYCGSVYKFVDTKCNHYTVDSKFHVI